MTRAYRSLLSGHKAQRETERRPEWSAMSATSVTRLVEGMLISNAIGTAVD